MTGTVRREHAVVLGASMAGLLTARVLSEQFERVTVVERDDLSVPGDRRGVPQGRHVHALLARGKQIFEELFPGITDRLLADGAVECRSLTEMRMTIAGHTLARSDGGYSLLQASRPFLEARVRERVRALANVTMLDRCAVAGLCADPRGNRVTGVRLHPADGPARRLDADLVVSCLGRHGPVEDWLAELGYERPAEEGVRIDMMYASRYVRLPAGSVGGDKEIVVANQDPARGLALFAIEDGMHILTLIGYGKDHPPTDSDGFWRFAASVAPPDVREALVDAEPLSEVGTFRYLANKRRRYERLLRFPRGLLVLGDAVCSFSPAFGQGMTVSALQALCLRAALAEGDRDLAPRFFRATARAIDDAWRITRLFDLAMPHVDSSGQPGLRALGALTTLGMAVGARDAVVGGRIARIAGLLDRPTAVLRPMLFGRAAVNFGLACLDYARSRGFSAEDESVTDFDPTPHGPARGFHRLPVHRVDRDTRDSVIVEFAVPQHLRDAFRYSAGQHVVVRGTHLGKPLRRSYSLCDPSSADRLRIAVKRQDGGIFSAYATGTLTAGTVLHVGEPTGTFTTPVGPHHYAAVAAGSGVTPIAALVGAVLGGDPGSTVTLHPGNRDADRIMLAARLAEFTTRFPGRLRVVHHLSGATATLPADGPGAEYRRGRIDPREVAGEQADRWLLCGPKDLVVDTVAALRANGVDRSRIAVELFDTRRTEPGTSPGDPRDDTHRAPSTDVERSQVTLTGHGPDLRVDVPRGATVLDAALAIREDLPYSCLGGSCGTCLATVESGVVDMDPDPLLAITEEQIARGRVLACRARPTSGEVTLRFGE